MERMIREAFWRRWWWGGELIVTIFGRRGGGVRSMQGVLDSLEARSY